MLAELKGVKKSYGAFQLDVTMQLEEGRITPEWSEKMALGKVRRLRRCWD